MVVHGSSWELDCAHHWRVQTLPAAKPVSARSYSLSQYLRVFKAAQILFRLNASKDQLIKPRFPMGVPKLAVGLVMFTRLQVSNTSAFDRNAHFENWPVCVPVVVTMGPRQHRGKRDDEIVAYPGNDDVVVDALHCGKQHRAVANTCDRSMYPFWALPTAERTFKRATSL